YREIERNGPAHEPVFTVVVEVMGHEQYSGCGLSKRAAEQQAAENMLKTVTCAKN
ncbi:MAG TPA: ribonuclease III, partial [Rhodospirillales bacterium]|nr:ribonuclease III [Rhodospirillales bacterium]